MVNPNARMKIGRRMDLLFTGMMKSNAHRYGTCQIRIQTSWLKQIHPRSDENLDHAFTHSPTQLFDHIVEFDGVQRLDLFIFDKPSKILRK